MTSARARYLLAMGLVPIGIVAACNREGPTGTPTTPDATQPKTPETTTDAAATTATSSPTAAPTETTTAATSATTSPSATTSARAQTSNVERHDAGAGTWTVVEKPAPTPPSTGGPSMAPPPPMPSCPSGRFCTHAPSKITHAAPAPFTSCEATLPSPHSAPLSHFSPDLTKSERATIADACCYSWFIPCPGGRPLRTDDGILLAERATRSDWTATDPGAATIEALDPTMQAQLAGYWLEQAAAEHASVASFNRFTLQLLALGAPADMIGSALAAAQDEVRHAQLCYGLAARYAGEDVGPGRLELPPGEVPVDPALVARETLRDGCLGESIAAELAREAARRAHDAVVTAILTQIADDEERHAELAWRTVAWLVAEHGDVVRREVATFAAELASESHEPRPSSDDAPIARHGVLEGATQLALRREVIGGILTPCLAALLAREPRRAQPESAAVLSA